MPHFPNFTTLPIIWLLTKLLFSSREVIFKKYIPKKLQAFWHKNFQTLWLDGIHVWHEIILRKGQRVHGTACDSNPCDSDRTDEEDRRTWTQIIHGQLLFFPWIVWWLGEETDLLLWHCQDKQESHATIPKTKNNETEKGRHSHMDRGWLDGNTVAGQERRMHVD